MIIGHKDAVSMEEIHRLISQDAVLFEDLPDELRGKANEISEGDFGSLLSDVEWKINMIRNELDIQS